MSRISRFTTASGVRTALRMARRCMAFAFGVLAFICLWTGLDPKLHLPVPSEATAESGITQPGFLPAPGGDSSGQPLPKAVLLQAAVDSVALGLGGTLSSLELETDRRAAVSKALDALTFDLGEGIHFTAWEGARLMHSPLSPDAADMDFTAVLDTRGVAFVRAMQECGEQGGFVQVTLPRRTYGLGGNAAGGTVSGPASRGKIVAPETDPFYGGAVRLVHTESEEILLVYTRRIPASNWQISAFMGKPGSGEGHALLAGAEKPFSSVWSASTPRTPQGPAQDDLRKGLWVSGLSLAGLAGLLLNPGAARREDDQ